MTNEKTKDETTERLGTTPDFQQPLTGATYQWEGVTYPMGELKEGPFNKNKEQARFMETQPGFKEWEAERGKRLMAQVLAAITEGMNEEVGKR